jgi:hypothetical protein
MIKFDDQLSSSSSLIVDVVDSCSRSLTTPVVVVEVHGSQQQQEQEEQEQEYGIYNKDEQVGVERQRRSRKDN